MRPAPRRWPALTALAVAVCAGVLGLGLLAGGTTAGVPQRTAVVSVGAGQTLWDMADRFAPDSDPVAVVRRIEQLNDLGGASVEPGIPLVVPVQRR